MAVERIRMRAPMKFVFAAVAALSLVLSLASQVEAQAPTGYQFFSVPPCRLFDSRSTDAPILAGGVARLVTPVGRCSVPTSAVAV